jgi:hypothetical protein
MWVRCRHLWRVVLGKGRRRKRGRRGDRVLPRCSSNSCCHVVRNQSLESKLVGSLVSSAIQKLNARQSVETCIFPLYYRIQSNPWKGGSAEYARHELGTYIKFSHEI